MALLQGHFDPMRSSLRCARDIEAPHDLGPPHKRKRRGTVHGSTARAFDSRVRGPCDTGFQRSKRMTKRDVFDNWYKSNSRATRF